MNAKLVRGLIITLLIGTLGCRQEGNTEKAGRKFDEVIDKLAHPNEGPVEKFGRKVDEAGEAAKEKME